MFVWQCVQLHGYLQTHRFWVVLPAFMFAESCSR